MSEREDGSEMAVRLGRGEWDRGNERDRSLKTTYTRRNMNSVLVNIVAVELQEMLQVGFECVGYWPARVPFIQGPLTRHATHVTPTCSPPRRRAITNLCIVQRVHPETCTCYEMETAVLAL